MHQLSGAPYDVKQKPRQLFVDRLGGFFVAEMPCACYGYEATVRRITLRALHRVG